MRMNPLYTLTGDLLMRFATYISWPVRHRQTTRFGAKLQRVYFCLLTAWLLLMTIVPLFANAFEKGVGGPDDPLHSPRLKSYGFGVSAPTGRKGALVDASDGPTCDSYINKTTVDGLGNNNVRAVYAVGSTVYAATAGLSISTDGGNTWTNKTTTNGLANNSLNGVYAVAGSPGSTTVYAATGGGLSFCNAGNLPTLTVGTATGSTTTCQGATAASQSFSVSGGSVATTTTYEIRKSQINNTGVFTIDQLGSYTITVTGETGCKRTVTGVIL